MTAREPERRGLNIDAALLAYLLPVLGPAYILALRREDAFSRYHAIQSLSIVAALILAPAVLDPFLMAYFLTAIWWGRRSIRVCTGRRRLPGCGRRLGGGNRQCSPCAQVPGAIFWADSASLNAHLLGG